MGYTKEHSKQKTETCSDDVSVKVSDSFHIIDYHRGSINSISYSFHSSPSIMYESLPMIVKPTDL